MSPLWTQEQIDYLLANYSKGDSAEICKHLNKSHTAVRVKANRLGLKKAPTDYMGMTKEAYWRFKHITDGNCPRCGKPAYPYYCCPKHREYERKRGVNGKPRTETHRPKRKLTTATGTVTKVGHITVHRLMG